MTCSMTDCDKTAVSRTWCDMHYTRWKRHGDPNGFAYIKDREARFWSYVDASGDCWIWMAFRRSTGHGTFSIGNRRMGFAHRIAWEYLVGEIPEGMEVHHLCGNPPCVNPDHLELLTHSAHVSVEKRRRYGRPGRPCSIRGCPNASVTRGWCQKHYKRWREHGDPLVAPPDEWERFWSRVDTTGDCWEWTGATHETGYGFCIRNGRKWYVHRLLWTTLVGPIPQDHKLIHRCSNLPCVNPDHLAMAARGN